MLKSTNGYYRRMAWKRTEAGSQLGVCQVHKRLCYTSGDRNVPGIPNGNLLFKGPKLPSVSSFIQVNIMDTENINIRRTGVGTKED
jgi:hypothetical protein